MSLKFIVKPSFAVMGIEGSGPAAESVSWIKPLWAEASRHFNEIRGEVVGPGWGLMSHPARFLDRWTDQGKYLAGWEVNQAAAARGRWSFWPVPAGIYAVIECTVKTYQEAMLLAEKSLQTDAHYEAAGAIHEHYPSTFKNPATDAFFLYVAVKKTLPRGES
ncbi:MAG TPA: GyrI-like domain-containing protein [Opitutaceae bacterium]|nr:GyrI-like domain-containing protein [Opitutaceae bacterium]